MIYNKINNIVEGDCFAGFSVKVKSDSCSYFCVGNTHDEAIKYFEEHWDVNKFLSDEADVYYRVIADKNILNQL